MAKARAKSGVKTRWNLNNLSFYARKGNDLMMVSTKVGDKKEINKWSPTFVSVRETNMEGQLEKIVWTRMKKDGQDKTLSLKFEDTAIDVKRPLIVTTQQLFCVLSKC